jgi:hypothetical protein
MDYIWFLQITYGLHMDYIHFTLHTCYMRWCELSRSHTDYMHITCILHVIDTCYIYMLHTNYIWVTNRLHIDSIQFKYRSHMIHTGFTQPFHQNITGTWPTLGPKCWCTSIRSRQLNPSCSHRTPPCLPAHRIWDAISSDRR